MWGRQQQPGAQDLVPVGRGLRRWWQLGAHEPAPVGAFPSTHGGRGLHMGRKVLMVVPPFVCHSTMVLHFYGGWIFFHENSWLWSSSLLSPQAVSSQPTVVLSPCLLSKPHIPTLSPHLHWWIHISGWGMEGCVTDHLCRSHFVLPATDQVLHSPPGP